MRLPVLSVRVHYENDVVFARQRARQIARLFGFEAQDQTRIATAVSEIVRNAFAYAGGGKVEFFVVGKAAPQVLEIEITDEGPGIADLAAILEGQYRSQTGLGLGIVGARRLVDRFEIDSAPGRGTTVRLEKIFPRTARALGKREIQALVDELARQAPQTALEEAQRQNQELLATLAELQQRTDELRRVNSELEDTNRGVVALLAELDEKAEHLRRADELKSRFLSNMSHEFRTPVNSVLALSQILLDRLDGELTAEQEKQVGYIKKAASELSELVNDLLDLAKVEAGKIVARPVEFEVANLFGALRGMLRPLLVNESVALIFEEPRGIPTMFTDESKVSQILRNFISNALKFTERGEVRVSARLSGDANAVVFSVADTGIGIAPEDQEAIFQEFTQLDSHLQRHVRGTGLGLPLSRRLAELLGGGISLVSAPGVGSTFSATIPVQYPETRGAGPITLEEPEAGAVPVLVVEDHPETRFVYERFLAGTRFRPLAAASLREARELLRQVRPHAIILDIVLQGEDSWSFLASLKANDDTRTIPVIVATLLDEERKARALGADAYCVKPTDRAHLVRLLERLVTGMRPARALIVDDDEASRYVMKLALTRAGWDVTEANTGEEGLAAARDVRPEGILLDLMLPGISGEDVLDALAADPATAAIPVVIVTSKALDPESRRRLEAKAYAVVGKDPESRARTVVAIREAWSAALSARKARGR